MPFQSDAGDTTLGDEPGHNSLPEDRKSDCAGKLPVWIIAVGILGLFLFIFQRDTAFPNVSLNLKIPKGEIQKMSCAWADKIGFASGNTLKSTIFRYDDYSKTFLELELGTDKANEVMRSEVPIWYWRTRLCKELKKEEIRVYLYPDGGLNSFAWDLDNDHELPSLSREAAQKLGEDFVTAQAKLSLQPYKLIESSDNTHAKRTDHSFTWERTMPDLHGASLRIFVTVSGNQVSYFDNYLKVPEAWQVKYKAMRSYNNLLWQIANVSFVLLQAIVACLLVREIAIKSIRWKFAMKVASVSAAGILLASLNYCDSLFANYSTNMSVSQFILNRVFSTIVGMIAAFLVTTMVAGVSESFYRRNFPKQMAMQNYFSLAALRTKKMSTALLAGVLLFTAGLGYQIAYYLTGEKLLHFYSPLGVSNYELLNGYFPFLSAIALGLFASLSEEILYRVFALTLLTKVTRNFWLANIVQAASWGFLHSTYDQQPCYVRGVEVMLWGILSGWIMRRFGVLPCIIEHYLFDAYLSSDILLRSSVLPLQLSGLLPTIPVIAIALLSWWLSRKSEKTDAQSLSNEALDTVLGSDQATPSLPAQEEPVYEPDAALSNRTRALLAASMVVASIGIAVLWYSFPYACSKTTLAINRQESISAAKEVMRGKHIDSTKYMVCAWLNSDTQYYSDAARYAAQIAGKPKATELVEKTADGFLWQVRFFQPENRTEYSIKLNGRGKLVCVAVTIPEEEKGAKLTSAGAQALVEQYLQEVKPVSAPLQFESVSEQKRPDRLDYTFVYACPDMRVADANLKVRVNVVGDVIDGPYKSWEVPDKWLFEDRKVTAREHIATIVQSIFGVACAIAVGWAAIGLLRSVTLSWRIAIAISGISALATLMQNINESVIQDSHYQASQPFVSFLIAQLTACLTGLIGAFGSTVILCCFAIACSKLLLPKFHLWQFVRTSISAGNNNNNEQQLHRTIWLDAVLSGMALTCLTLLIHQCFQSMKVIAAPFIFIDGLEKLTVSANSYLPLLDQVTGVLREGGVSVLLVAVCAGLYAKYFSRPIFFVAFVAAGSLLINSGAKYPYQVVLNSADGFCQLMLMYVFVTKVTRANLLSYFVSGLTYSSLTILLTYVDHTTNRFLFDAITVSAVPFLPLLYLAICFARNSKS